MTFKPFCFALALMAPTVASADIAVRFIEGAPTDRFEITNTSACAVTDLSVTINLVSSAGRLIFDTTAEGAGVEVFQPMRITKGGDSLAGASPVTDGDQSVTLAINALDAGGVIAFTTDLDGQLDESDLGQIRVTNAELAGAELTVTAPVGRTIAKFGTSGMATVANGDCDA